MADKDPKIDEQMNVVIHVAGMNIHSTAISYEVFEKYFSVLSKTFNALYGEIGVLGAPKVAYLTLKRIAERDGEWTGPEGVENGLINEIIRLSNVAVPKTGAGWQSLPLYEVFRQGMLTPKQKAEVLSELCFFTVASCMHQQETLKANLQVLVIYWQCAITASDFTAYLNGLQTSTKAETTAEKAAQ